LLCGFSPSNYNQRSGKSDGCSCALLCVVGFPDSQPPPHSELESKTAAMDLAMRVYRAAILAVVCVALPFAGHADAQLPFFPGAEGFGAGSIPSSGWLSNATVYHVTNLSDSGPGSFRNAFVQGSSNKIIVFDVAGTIQLGSVLDIKNLSNYYIAGQTAPGPVTVFGNTTQITHSNNTSNSNVILRYITFRRGTAASGDDDTVTIKSSTSDGSGAISSNIMVDHVSASWGTDENLSVANNNTNVTVQYSLINDALRADHAFGSLIRPRIDSNVTYHHNLYANNASRQARFGTYFAKTLTADFRNNVIYNFRDRASYTGGSSEPAQEFSNVNYVGNYIIAGPGTGSVPDEYGGADVAYRVDKNVTAQVYQSGNFIDPDEALGEELADGVLDGSNTGEAMFVVSTPITDQSLTFVDTPFAAAPVTTQTASAAYQQLVDYAGNWWWNRDMDVVDKRAIGNVTDFTGEPLGAAEPIEDERLAVVNAPMATHAAGYDTDGDAMSNDWEDAHGLNRDLASDWNGDFDSDGYINLIEYINELGEFPAPAPIVYVGPTSGASARFELVTNWRTSDGVTAGSNWQPSKYDEAQINGGTIVSNKVGQHAGTLKLGAGAGNVATLNVSGGWLDVENEVVIGDHASATATLNLTGGRLTAGSLRRGSGDTFNFTGGTLSAESVHFDLVNNGGTIAPGQSIGQTHVLGNLTLASGTLQIELASLEAFDKLLVDGAATLGGSLNVVTVPGFNPVTGNNWQIISAGDLLGDFTSVTAGFSVQKQGDSLMLYFGAAPPAVFAGDYNDDGVVDVADFVVWSKGGLPLANETASGGIVNNADYLEWSMNFGASEQSGSGGLSAVPEPSVWSATFAILAGAAAFRGRTRHCGFSGVFCKNSCLAEM
jgi:hypothetical protein